MLAVTGVITAVSVWAFTTGRPAIGIAILVAFYILPTLVMTPVRIRRSRRRAEEARAQREQRAGTITEPSGSVERAAARGHADAAEGIYPSGWKRGSKPNVRSWGKPEWEAYWGAQAEWWRKPGDSKRRRRLALQRFASRFSRRP